LFAAKSNGQAVEPRIPPLSRIARTRKLEFFFSHVEKDAKVLDVGCADGWVERWTQAQGFSNVIGLDLVPPADIVGDVSNWRSLGIAPHSFDAIVAFEVIEHGDIVGALHELTRPGGLLLATTPVPGMDWACRLMERIGMLQRRTSPHSHLTDLRLLPDFEVVDHRIKGFVSQWGVLRAA